MRTEKNLAERENGRRKPGQRPDLREREELLLQVERALANGAKNPGEVLGDVPALGTWDTAKAYADEVRARWRAAGQKDALREARGEMVAAARMARQRALVGMSMAEKPSEIARLAREVERLLRCEAWLLGLDPKTLDRDEDEEADQEVPQWLRKMNEEIAREEAEKGTAENPPDTSPARNDPTNLTEEASVGS